MTPVQLQIRLLGSPNIIGAGCLLSIPRSQTRALLYRLAMAPAPLAREQLCFLFWPGDDSNTARRKLTQALSHLRRSLPDSDLVETTADQIGLHPVQVWTDVVAFDALCTQNKYQIDKFTEAVDLYRDPFSTASPCPMHRNLRTGNCVSAVAWNSAI